MRELNIAECQDIAGGVDSDHFINGLGYAIYQISREDLPIVIVGVVLAGIIATGVILSSLESN